MRIKRLAALSLAAVFTASLLAGCDLLAWLAWLEENSDSSSVTSSSSSSSSISRPNYDEDDDDDDAPSQPPAEPEKPEPDPAKPETWQVSEDGSTLIVPSGATSEQITKDLFETHSNITSLDLRGSGVTTIDESAFDGCINLQRVTMGDMDNIGYRAFYNCTSLQSVTMGNVATIDMTAFTNCQNLKTIDMGFVQNIGGGAFAGCLSLTSIRFKNDTAGPSVASGAFQEVGIQAGGVTVYSDWAMQNQARIAGEWFPHLPHPLVHTSGYDA